MRASMKKFLLSMMLLAELIFAEETCRLDEWFHIEIRNSSIWYGENSFLSGCFAVVGDSLSEMLADGYKCSKRGEFEKAFLDSNVYIRKKHEHMVDVIWLYVYVKTDHKTGDVFRDEFLHWQQCGMLNLTYEEADSLVTPLAEALNEYYANEILGDCYESDVFYASGVATGTIPSQIVKWADEACATTSVELPRRTSSNNIVYENSRVHIPVRLQGEKYFIFDMNGRILQKGIATETIDLPTTPSILKIGKEIFTP